jgi:hypothetical protein
MSGLIKLPDRLLVSVWKVIESPDRRNGFVRPLKLTLKTRREACLHPAWLVEFMRLGPPMLNWQA